MFLFATVFMDTAATSRPGARGTLEAQRLHDLMASSCRCCSTGSTATGVWGGGWLAQLGSAFGWPRARRFRGLVGRTYDGRRDGFGGLAGRGSPIGKFRRDGTISVIPGHNLPMAMIGTGILAFGFGSGSTRAPRCRLAIHASR